MTETKPPAEIGHTSPLQSVLDWLGVEPAALRAVAWSFATFFAVLCSYYIIRPLRDEMGVTVGADGRERLFFIVFLVMLGAVPLFGWLVSTFPKKHVAPLVYAFAIS